MSSNDQPSEQTPPKGGTAALFCASIAAKCPEKIAERDAQRQERRKKCEQQCADKQASDDKVQCQKHKKPKKPCDCTGAVLTEEFVMLQTQADVDMFAKDGDIAILDGNMLISSGDNDPIVNLNGLAALCEITGSLSIEETTHLQSLSGLENLQRIGNALLLNINSGLESIAELRSLRTIGGILNVFENASLTEITGFDCLEYVGTFLNVFENASLTEITGFDCLEYVGFNIVLQENPVLTKIGGFNAKAGLCVGKGISIAQNVSLQVLDGFDGLISVQEILEIALNDAMVTVKGFGRLEAVFNAIAISQNAALQTVDAFPNLVFSGNIRILQCNLLHTVAAFEKLQRMETLVLFELPALANLDAFQRLRFAGPISLTQIGLRSVDAFASLQFVRGNLEIGENAFLADLDGLISVKQVSGSIELRNNSRLETLDGLSRLQESAQVQAQLTIDDNPVLASYCGLQPLADADATGSPAFAISGNALDLTKDEIALLEPCGARKFFERTINRWLTEKAIKKSTACSLAHSMTKATVRKWHCVEQLTFSQAALLLAALDRCLFAGDNHLPPRGPPLQIDIDCCAAHLSGAQRFAFLTAKCRKAEQRAHVLAKRSK